MGNGCNAQVFGSKMKEVALKVMPIEEADTRPHRSVMTVAEAFNEVVATIQLSRLAYVENTHFRTDNYVELKQIRLFRGCTPELLRRAWQSHNEKSGKNGEIYCMLRQINWTSRDFVFENRRNNIWLSSNYLTINSVLTNYVALKAHFLRHNVLLTLPNTNECN